MSPVVRFAVLILGGLLLGAAVELPNDPERTLGVTRATARTLVVVGILLGAGFVYFATFTH